MNGLPTFSGDTELVNDKVIEICRRLELVGKAYQAFSAQTSGGRLWFFGGGVLSPLKKVLKDAYLALASFIKGYAYVRQGPLDAYRFIAEEALCRVFGGKIVDIKKSDVTNLWKEYQAIAKSFSFRKFKFKLNPNLNPLNKDKGILARMMDRNITNIAEYIYQLLKGMQCEEAFQFLVSIRGVGVKIASLYLRDIVFLAQLNNLQRHHLLQPIDTWVDKTLRIIMEADPSLKKTLQKIISRIRDTMKANRSLKRLGPITTAKQRLIIKICSAAKCCPIAFNQGAWFTGSRLARDNRILIRILTSSSWSSFLQKLINCRSKERQDELRVLQSLLSRMP